MKILVRLPNALGDMVMGTAFISLLYKQYPQAIIHIILKKEIAETAELIPYPVIIHKFSKNEYKGLAGLYNFGKTLQKERFDLLFCLPESISSTVMCWATKAKQRIGFSNTLNSLLFTKSFARQKNTHRVLEYASLLEKFTNQKFSNFQTELKVESEDVALALINFNSEAISRRMPYEKAISILKNLSINFPNTKFGLIGSPKEAEYVDSLINQFPSKNFISLAGKTTIKSLASLMKAAKFMLSTDSGPSHLANSLGVPLLVLFGAGDENNTAPYNKKNLHILRLGQLPCEPCVKNTCIYGLPKCLELLENQNILNIFSNYLIN